MNKKDLPLFIVLIGLLLAWPYVDRKYITKILPPKPAPAASAVLPEAPPPETAPANPVTPPPAETKAPETAPEGQPAATQDPSREPVDDLPETEVGLKNDKLEIVVSSRGAAIKSARLQAYRATVASDSPPVQLDFAGRPALSYDGLNGLSADYSFRVVSSREGREVVLERTAASGLRLVRTLRLEDTYLLTVTEAWTNVGAAPVVLPAAGLQLGPMQNLPGETSVKGMPYLGIDTQSPGEKATYWSKQFKKLFDAQQAKAALPALPVTVDYPLPPEKATVDWAAVKNKYFAQILSPKGGAEGVTLQLRRDVPPEELQGGAKRIALNVSEVSATVSFREMVLQPGGEPFERAYQYYLGPKKYDELAPLGDQVNVMEFGMWAPVGKILLRILNGIHAVLPNYGIAIILLTILIRIVFWPITHKSTQSMKRMAEVQPLVAALRAKYKDSPQKLQQETMKLYKEHKINPVGGCLPMLIQIPVFIALFVVLRSAIELRFAPFLWIHDLSEPERIFSFGFALPLLGWDSLNILPLIMTITQVWQQKLTPTAGDPAQQKMMTLMPIIMLVFFYTFASGLVLYWTTNQCLMIVQQLLQKRKRAHAGT